MRLSSTVLILLLSVSILEASKNSPHEITDKLNLFSYYKDLGDCVNSVYHRKFVQLSRHFPGHPKAHQEVRQLFGNFIRGAKVPFAGQTKMEKQIFMHYVNNHVDNLIRRLSDLKGEWLNRGDEYVLSICHLSDIEDKLMETVTNIMTSAYDEYCSLQKEAEFIRPIAVKPVLKEDSSSGLLQLEILSSKFDPKSDIFSPLSLNFEPSPVASELSMPSFDFSFVGTPAAAASAPTSLKKPSETKWPVDEFRNALRHTLETEWQYAFEGLADLPQCSHLLDNIHAFPEKLFSATIDFSGSFDKIMTALNSLLEQLVRDDAFLTVSARMDFDSEMYTDIVNMVYPEVVQQFYTICSKVLSKYFVNNQSTGKATPLMDVDFSDFELVPLPIETELNDYIPLDGFDNYLRLASRIGIDHREPKSLMEEKNIAKLRQYGYDIWDPAFQNFLNDACMHLAASENNENIPPAPPLSPKPRKAKHSTSVQRRLERNLAIIAQLKALLDQPEFVSDFQKALIGEAGDADMAELFADQISQSLSDLVTADWNCFEPTPSSPKPRYMHLIIKEAIELKCREISDTMGCEELGARMATEANTFIGARIFPRDEKSSAVSSWHASYDEMDSNQGHHARPVSPIQLIPSAASGSGKVTFSDEKYIKDFDHRSPPMAISDESIAEPVTSAPAYRPITYNQENCPEFPFDTPNDVMARPAYLTETADYLRQHGETRELHLDARIDAADVALSNVIDEGLPESSVEVRDAVHQLYFEMLMETLKPSRATRK